MPDPHTALTGIPIEVLFSLVGGLGLVIYADMKYEIRRLRKQSERRGDQLLHLDGYMSRICDKLGIDYRSHGGEDD